VSRPALFVGGPWDGQRRWLHQSPQEYHLALPKPLTLMEPEDIPTATIRIHAYRLHGFSRYGELNLYVSEDLTEVALIERLMLCYQPLSRTLYAASV
jgi:hypothetical protein